MFIPDGDVEDGVPFVMVDAGFAPQDKTILFGTDDTFAHRPAPNIHQIAQRIPLLENIPRLDAGEEEGRVGDPNTFRAARAEAGLGLFDARDRFRRNGVSDVPIQHPSPAQDVARARDGSAHNVGVGSQAGAQFHCKTGDFAHEQRCAGSRAVQVIIHVLFSGEFDDDGVAVGFQHFLLFGEQGLGFGFVFLGVYVGAVEDAVLEGE